MALQKTANHAMEYELTGSKKVKDPEAVARKAYHNEVDRRSSLYTLWLLAVKHRVLLLAIGNVVLVLNWVFPEWLQMVKSL